MIEKADLAKYPRGGTAISKNNGRLIGLRSDSERDHVQVPIVSAPLAMPEKATCCPFLTAIPNPSAISASKTQ